MTTQYSASIEAHRARAWGEQKALLDALVKEDRDPTDTEKRKIEHLGSLITDADAELAYVTRASKLLDNAPASRSALSGRTENTTMDTHGIQTIDLGHLLSEARLRGGSAAEVSLPQYREAQTRALSSGSDTVPADFLSSLVTFEREAAPMYAAADVLDRDTARDVIMPRLTADVTAASTATAEGAGISEDDATLSSVTASVYKLAIMQLVSNELVRDTGIGELTQQLAQSAGRALGYKANGWFTTGTGSGQPYGLATRAVNGGTAAGTAFDANVSGDSYYSWGDIIDIQGYVPANILPRASYMTSPAGLRAAMKWRDNTGAPIFEPATPGVAVNGGPAGRLWGYDVWVNSDISAPGSAVKGWFFGDFQAFKIADVGGLNISFSSDWKYGNDQLAIRIIREVASDLPDVTAIAYQVAADT